MLNLLFPNSHVDYYSCAVDHRLDLCNPIVSWCDCPRQIAGGGGGRSSCGCVKRIELVEIVETGMATSQDLNKGSASTCTTDANR
jgi:hypothetical protein